MVNRKPLYYSTTYLVRLTPEQFQIVANSAERLKMSISAYTRVCLGLEDSTGTSLTDLSKVKVKPRTRSRRKVESDHGKEEEA
jgi:hypothetical protein